MPATKTSEIYDLSGLLLRQCSGVCPLWAPVEIRTGTGSNPAFTKCRSLHNGQMRKAWKLNWTVLKPWEKVIIFDLNSLITFFMHIYWAKTLLKVDMYFKSWKSSPSNGNRWPLSNYSIKNCTSVLHYELWRHWQVWLCFCLFFHPHRPITTPSTLLHFGLLRNWLWRRTTTGMLIFLHPFLKQKERRF